MIKENYIMIQFYIPWLRISLPTGSLKVKDHCSYSSFDMLNIFNQPDLPMRAPTYFSKDTVDLLDRSTAQLIH